MFWQWLQNTLQLIILPVILALAQSTHHTNIAQVLILCHRHFAAGRRSFLALATTLPLVSPLLSQSRDRLRLLLHPVILALAQSTHHISPLRTSGVRKNGWVLFFWWFWTFCERLFMLYSDVALNVISICCPGFANTAATVWQRRKNTNKNTPNYRDSDSRVTSVITGHGQHYNGCSRGVKITGKFCSYYKLPEVPSYYL